MSLRTIALASLLALGTSAVFADAPYAEMPEPPANEGPAFSEFSATRLDDTQVQLKLTFEGGACQSVDTPELGETTEGTLAVTIPTSSTAEVCTMQIVPIPVDATIDAPADVEALDVTIVGTNGEPQVSGIVEITAE